MLQTTAISRSLERALPGNLREAPEVTSVLSQKIHSAGIFNFDDSAKTSGIFAVAKGEAEWMGGQLAARFRYVLTRGDKILSSGELVGTKKISGSYEVRINTSSTEIKERDLEKGTPPFVIELVLDEPKKSRITLRADREVIVDGEVNVRLLSRGQVEIGQSSFGSTTQVVPTGRVVSLTEHALDRSGIRLRAADSPEMTRFPNTLVGLWMYIPSMDKTLKAQL
ncbi:MAG: hypothetical protein J0M12_17465, partial [Deltaproteobacteria bacterium]|nr:hypothetical protein [Deltaproteobacteria bacterium]